MDADGLDTFLGEFERDTHLKAFFAGEPLDNDPNLYM